jgi:hypothetical protein
MWTDRGIFPVRFHFVNLLKKVEITYNPVRQYTSMNVDLIPFYSNLTLYHRSKTDGDISRTPHVVLVLAFSCTERVIWNPSSFIP